MSTTTLSRSGPGCLRCLPLFLSAVRQNQATARWAGPPHACCCPLFVGELTFRCALTGVPADRSCRRFLSHRKWSSLTESGPIRWFVSLNLVRDPVDALSVVLRQRI